MMRRGRPIYLRTLRQARGLSQEQLQTLSRVPQNTISRLESNQLSKPSWDTVRALAEALHVDPRVLRFGPDPAARPLSKDEARAS